jgi:succinylarginine dihydrolase
MAAPAILEANFDGIVGPTHNYAGLAYGNVASLSNQGVISKPRTAVLEGLRKMNALRGLGLVQGVLPPLERPDLGALRRIGFAGSDADVISAAARTAPQLLAACSSVSSMWTANAGTFAPGTDTADGKPHFVPANLVSAFHRSLEPRHTARHFARIFPAPHFEHHGPLPACPQFGDEGAANHTRLVGEGGVAVHLFVYGRLGFVQGSGPKRFPARQTLEASEGVARLLSLPPERTLFVEQNPAVIDEGVFHNDVIAVGNGNVLFLHESAFVDTPTVLAELRRRLGEGFFPFVVTSAELTVREAVETYLFNSQLVTLPDGTMCLVAPRESEEHPRARAVIDRLLASGGPVRQARFFDLRESMRNGGGPACLRFRVVLGADDLRAVHPGVLLDDRLYDALVGWAETHYRDELSPKDLADPALLSESRAALDALAHILRLPRLYPFQE